MDIHYNVNHRFGMHLYVFSYLLSTCDKDWLFYGNVLTVALFNHKINMSYSELIRLSRYLI